jgi:hypothetical protein
MQDKTTTIYYRTYRRMRLDERVQPYVFQAGFLYVTCLDRIKLDYDLIYVLIEL